MIFIYELILPILVLLFLPFIICALIIQPKFRAGFITKCGKYNKIKTDKNVIVFHAVSVGEVNAISDLIKKYRKNNEDKFIVLTTTTKTGQEVAKKSLLNFVDEITYFPFDLFFSVNSFLNSYNPTKIIIAETEIWPCFSKEVSKRNIKLYVVNGRISPHSFDGYKKIKFFLSKVLNCYELILMQTKSDSERIIGIGANEDKVRVMGNLKFDITQNLSFEDVKNLRDELKIIDNNLFVAASTHQGEDEIALAAFNELKKQHSQAKMLLVPRHPQRYSHVINLLEKSGYKYGKRSEKSDFSDNDIILLDTMGELSKMFSIAKIAFIGGSFSGTGGHNPLEANIWGIPVISGNSVFNFKDIYKLLTQKESAIIVDSKEKLTEELISFYNDDEKYNRYCINSKQIFVENKGAINFVLNII